MPSELMSQVAIMAGMEVIHRFSNLNFHCTKAILAVAIAECLVARIRDQHYFLYIAPFLRMILQLPVGVWFHLTISIMEKAVPCFELNRHSGYGYTFHACSAFAKTTNCVF